MGTLKSKQSETPCKHFFFFFFFFFFLDKNLDIPERARRETATFIPSRSYGARHAA